MTFIQNIRLTLVTLASLGLAAHPHPAAAQSIGIDFVGSGNAVGGTAGVVPQANWNNEYNSTGTSGNLVDGTGATLNGTTVTWKADYTFGTSNAGGENGNLMSGYLDSNGSTVTVSNVPYASYDVYVYANSDVGYYNRLAQYTVNGVTKTNATGGGATPFNGTFVTDPTGTGATTGNYLKFAGVSGATLSLTTGSDPGSSGNDLNYRTPIAGIEIVAAPAPEPSQTAALGLGVLGLAGLVFTARKRRPSVVA